MFFRHIRLHIRIMLQTFSQKVYFSIRKYLKIEPETHSNKWKYRIIINFKMWLTYLYTYADGEELKFIR